MDHSESRHQHSLKNNRHYRALTPIISESSRRPSPATTPLASRAVTDHPRTDETRLPIGKSPGLAAENRHDKSVVTGKPKKRRNDRQVAEKPSSQTVRFTHSEAQQRPLRFHPPAFVPDTSPTSAHERFMRPSKFNSDVQDNSPDKADSPTPSIPILRQASLGRKGKPVFTTIRRSDSTRAHQQGQEEGQISTNKREETIRALSAAIVAGFNPTTPTRPYPHAESSTPEMRMPFSGSPTSTYTANDSDNDQPDSGGAGRDGSVEPVPLRPSPLVGNSPSSVSMNPLLGPGAGQRGMSDRIPDARRPPRLNIEAVREAESRGSITSLPELIRRATRLASNLDRGKTASRLGLEHVFTGGKGVAKNEHTRGDSTYSDMLFAFPKPGVSTPSVQQPTKLTPAESFTEKSATQTSSRRDHRRSHGQAQRRCCGLSMRAFIILTVVIVLLVAAAVIIPVFLVWVPKQHQDSMDLRQCSVSHSCSNGGISLIDNNACACICVDGFTGSQCSIAADPGCITTDLREGSTSYDNATLGSSILPLLSNSKPMFNIPLNASILLSIFAANNLSCSGENSLVTFSTEQGGGLKRDQSRKRQLFMIPGLSHEGASIRLPSRSLNVPLPKHSAILKARQSVAATSNDVVYQTTTTTSSQASSTSHASQAYSSSTVSVTSSSSSATSSISVTGTQVEFAQIIVLYVLAKFRVPNTAVNAQQILEQYLRAGGPSSGKSTVNVVTTGRAVDKVTADFAQFLIELGDGTTVGD